ncbi:hypothetical protein PoB_003853000 [Plakobranchus ocellatus]|uniref:Uncharacterized protein n=1 Tax=Plakobranchus ocellatus TaxID=259542 RepID=A0AAV4AUK4_9GAST|nr:hypothetical protein PoB_003853000 [Plakobranchus ocellatus]
MSTHAVAQDAWVTLMQQQQSKYMPEVLPPFLTTNERTSGFSPTLIYLSVRLGPHNEKLAHNKVISGFRPRQGRALVAGFKSRGSKVGADLRNSSLTVIVIGGEAVETENQIEEA